MNHRPVSSAAAWTVLIAAFAAVPRFRWPRPARRRRNLRGSQAVVRRDAPTGLEKPRAPGAGFQARERTHVHRRRAPPGAGVQLRDRGGRGLGERSDRHHRPRAHDGAHGVQGHRRGRHHGLRGREAAAGRRGDRLERAARRAPKGRARRHDQARGARAGVRGLAGEVAQVRGLERLDARPRGGRRAEHQCVHRRRHHRLLLLACRPTGSSCGR